MAWIFGLYGSTYKTGKNCRTDTQHSATGRLLDHLDSLVHGLSCTHGHAVDELDAAGLIHRPVEGQVLERFMACGDLHHGFALIYCDQCGHDFLLAYSCKTRYFGPSCHQKRMLAYGQWLGENLLAPVARYMIRCPFALEKMRYDGKSGMVIYRSRLHATLKRNYQLMPALKWLRLLLNHVPDKYEHLVRYYGYYSNRSRGARRLAEQAHGRSASIVINEPPPKVRRKASWARLIQRVYEVDPLECLNCGATMRIIALIDDADVIERILQHLKVWDPVPEPRSPSGTDPPWPRDETIPLSYHPLPDIA